MNKAELVERLADYETISKAQAGRTIDYIFASIDLALQRGERVPIPGFGTFVPQMKPASKERNPRTGEPIDIPERATVKFRASRALRDGVTNALSGK